MAKIIDKLWNWGHLAGSHNHWLDQQSTMSPEDFATAYGIKNSFIVSFGGNIQPPFADLTKRMHSLKEIKWSVLGDASTPLPDAELGMYLWDYGGKGAPMDSALFTKQLSHYFDLVQAGEIEGVLFCSNTIGDLDLETNRILKRFIQENGQREVLTK